MGGVWSPGKDPMQTWGAMVVGKSGQDPSWTPPTVGEVFHEISGQTKDRKKIVFLGWLVIYFSYFILGSNLH